MTDVQGLWARYGEQYRKGGIKDRTEYWRQYYEKNKDAIKLRRAKAVISEGSMERTRQKQHEYYWRNIDKIRQDRRERYLARREQIKLNNQYKETQP